MPKIAIDPREDAISHARVSLWSMAKTSDEFRDKVMEAIHELQCLLRGTGPFDDLPNFEAQQYRFPDQVCQEIADHFTAIESMLDSSPVEHQPDVVKRLEMVVSAADDQPLQAFMAGLQT